MQDVKEVKSSSAPRLAGVANSIAVLIVPSLITNIWQSLVGGNFIMLMKRMWLFFLCAIAGIWLGVIILASQDTVQLVAVLGGLLIAYSAISLTGFQIPVPGRREPWIAPIIGGLAGIAYGCTGSFVMPGTIFVQALRMPRGAEVTDGPSALALLWCESLLRPL